MKKIQNIFKVSLVLAASLNGLKAEQGNEILFDNGEGKIYGINRMELATHHPEDAGKIVSILEESFGEPELGELNRESIMVPTAQVTPSAGGLVESNLGAEFLDLEGEGFLSASIGQTPAKYGIPTSLAQTKAFPTSIYPESVAKKGTGSVSSICDSFPVSYSTADGIPDANWWGPVNTGGGVSISWFLEQEKPIAGPAGTQVKFKLSVSGNTNSQLKSYEVKSGVDLAGREVTEKNHAFSIRVTGECKMYYGSEKTSFSGKIGRRIGVDYRGEVTGEMGVKGSISTSVNCSNYFVDRNAARSGSVKLDGRISLTIEAYAEVKIKLEYNLNPGNKWRGLDLAAGVSVSGTASLVFGFSGSDWDHTLAATHPSKPQSQSITTGAINLSYRVSGYAKLKFLKWEIKPSITFSGSKTFGGEKTIILSHLEAIDQFM